jgi:arsenate reductase
MAEGLLRSLAKQTGASFEASSAGTEATGVKPEARIVMAEIGIDISGQESKTLDRYLDERFEYVIPVRDAANDSYPAVPGPAERLHWSLPDPSAVRGGEEERLTVSRSARDRLKRHVQTELIGRGR